MKGIAYPVATYSVIDTRENMKMRQRHFHEERANVKLEMKLDAMTLDDRDYAVLILRQAWDLISSEEDHAQSEETKKETTVGP